MPTWTPSSLVGWLKINLTIERCRFGRWENWSLTPVEVCAPYADMPTEPADAGLVWSAELGLEGLQRMEMR
jgi:hypothetical protein